MPKRPEMFQPYPRPPRAAQREADARRGSAHERGYSFRWTKTSKLFLQHNPLCAFCLLRGAITAATVTDHIKPHGGDMTLFWQRENWQALCSRCHNRDKKSIEMRNADKDWTIQEWREACEREVKK